MSVAILYERVRLILSQSTEVFNAVIGWVVEVGEVIAEQPILLLAVVGVPLCGLAVGLFKRLLSARA